MFESMLASVHTFWTQLSSGPMFDSVFASLSQLPNAFLLLVCASLVAAQTLSIRRMRRQLSARDDALHALEDEVRALLSCSKGIGDQLHRQQRHMRMLLERQGQIEQQDSGSRDFRQALVLLDRGASIDELMGACGLSRAEADLLVHMYKLRQAA